MTEIRQVYASMLPIKKKKKKLTYYYYVDNLKKFFEHCKTHQFSMDEIRVESRQSSHLVPVPCL